MNQCERYAAAVGLAQSLADSTGYVHTIRQLPDGEFKVDKDDDVVDYDDSIIVGHQWPQENEPWL